MLQDSIIRGILLRVASGLFSWSMAAGLMAFASRQFAPTHNQSWTSVRFTYYVYFCFLSKRS